MASPYGFTQCDGWVPGRSVPKKLAFQEMQIEAIKVLIDPASLSP